MMSLMAIDRRPRAACSMSDFDRQADSLQRSAANQTLTQLRLRIQPRDCVVLGGT